MFDLIQPHRLLDFVVVDQITRYVFLIRFHFQQDQVANDRVVDFRVIKLLVSVVDWFGIDAFARFCVVFDFDRQVAADCFDKDFVVDRNVWVGAVVVLVTRRSRPTKFVLWWIFDFVLGSIVQVLQRIRCYSPFK